MGGDVGTRDRASSTWLDGLGDWTWPGSAPALELTPAAWVPVLPLPVALPRPVAPARSRTLPRALRLARLAALLAIGAATFVLSSGIHAAPSRCPARAAPARASLPR